MIATKKVTFIELTDNCIAKLTVKRDRQEDPKYGDGVVVCGIIGILSDSGEIPKEIRFCSRVEILGEAFYTIWGIQAGEYREISAYFTAKTWKEAFVDAQVKLENEISKLVDVIEKRKQALIDAEK